MKEEFENLESVPEMMAYLMDNKEAVHHQPSLDLNQELNILGVQTFLKMFSRYKAMDSKDREEIEQCAETYNDAENNFVTRQSAMAHVCELFFPENKTPEKEIIRKNDSKVYVTPCEDCTSSPTHLVVFKSNNRTEEHFLCEECEKAAHQQEGDGE